MSDQQVFYNEFIARSQTQCSGKLFVYCRASEHGGLGRPAEFTLNAGEVISIHFGGLAGRMALSSLLSAAIDRVMFVESQAISGQRDGETPDSEEVVAIAQYAITGDRDRIAQIAGFDRRYPELLAGAPGGGADQLIAEVAAVFSQVYGQQATEKAERLAKQFPPQQNSREFLAQCQENAAMMLGKSLAKQLFEPIFEKSQGPF